MRQPRKCFCFLAKRDSFDEALHLWWRTVTGSADRGKKGFLPRSERSHGGRSERSRGNVSVPCNMMKSDAGENSLYWLYRIVALLWMAVIYWLSSKPSLPTPDLFWGQDKVEHAVAFGLLGFLFASSFRGRKQVFFGKHLIIVTFFVGAYGLFDEAHQFFVPGRIPSFWDLCADVTGGFLAALLLLRYRSRKFSRQELPPLS